MAGPIGHGVSKAMREARDKGAFQKQRGRPPWWVWALIAALLLAAMAWAAVTLR